MPEVCRFFGIIIRMFPREHNPPHFHAEYGEHEGVFSIETGQMIQGNLPAKKSALITAWCFIHKKELKSNWIRLEKNMSLNKIDPLR